MSTPDTRPGRTLVMRRAPRARYVHHGTRPLCRGSRPEARTSAVDAIAAGLRAPSGGRVLTDSPVDRLTYQVGVAGVPPILLDQIADQPAQAGVAAVGAGEVHGLVKPTVRQGRVEPRARPFDGAVPQVI